MRRTRGPRSGGERCALSRNANRRRSPNRRRRIRISRYSRHRSSDASETSSAITACSTRAGSSRLRARAALARRVRRSKLPLAFRSRAGAISALSTSRGSPTARWSPAPLRPRSVFQAMTLRTLADLVQFAPLEQAFLVLDNCEHLIADVALLVSALSRSCPGVAFLAASRERLAVSGEAVYRLPSLDLPTEMPRDARSGTTLCARSSSSFSAPRRSTTRSHLAILDVSGYRRDLPSARWHSACARTRRRAGCRCSVWTRSGARLAKARALARWIA